MPRNKSATKKKPTESATSTRQAPPSVLDRHSYLKGIVEIDEKDHTKFNCLLCTSNQPIDKKGHQDVISGALSWLKKHLETQTHTGFTPIDDKVKLREAISTLGRQTKSESPLKLPEATQIQAQELAQTPITPLPLSKDSEAALYLDLAKFSIENHIPFNATDNLLKLVELVLITT